jgi:hypothetical protein
LTTENGILIIEAEFSRRQAEIKEKKNDQKRDSEDLN